MLRPAQKLDQGYFRADLAAYRLSSAMGLRMVPPTCERTLDRKMLYKASGRRWRKRLDRELLWNPDGQSVQASALMWVEDVESAELEHSRRRWRPLLRRGRSFTGVSPEVSIEAAEASRLIAWDFLIANWDRWSGNNTFQIANTGIFIWLDNAAGFGHETKTMRKRRAAKLRRMDRFSRTFIDALRDIGADELLAAVEPAGLPEQRLADLVERRRLLLEYVDQLIAAYGDDQILVFE